MPRTPQSISQVWSGIGAGRKHAPPRCQNFTRLRVDARCCGISRITQGRSSDGGHRAWRLDGADEGPLGAGRRRKCRRGDRRPGRVRRCRRQPAVRRPGRGARPGALGHPGHSRGCRRGRLPTPVDRRDLDRPRRSRDTARRVDRPQGRERDAGVGLHGRGRAGSGRRRRHRLRPHRPALRGAVYRHFGGGRHRRRGDLRRAPPGLGRRRRRGGGRACRDGRRRRGTRGQSRRHRRRRLGRRHSPDQAGAGGRDVARRFGARRAGDRPGEGRRAGVGQRAVVRVVDGRAGLRARPGDGRGRPADAGRTGPRNAARLPAPLPRRPRATRRGERQTQRGLQRRPG